MEDTRFTFVSKFRVDNLDFKVFANPAMTYFVVSKNEEDGTEEANYYTNFDEMFSVFSDDITPEQLRGI